MLYQAVPEVYHIFKALSDTGDSKGYQKATDALTKHFEPSKNRIFEVYTFRQAEQKPHETIDEFHSRLRTISAHCRYYNVDFEMKIKTSARIPRKALRNDWKLDRIFSTHGIPKQLKSDNGPPFNGEDFKRQTQVLGIKWIPSTPFWPQTYANAEIFMKPIGKLVKTSRIEGKSWKQDLRRFLLNYRRTPHMTRRISLS